MTSDEYTTVAREIDEATNNGQLLAIIARLLNDILLELRSS